jgi:hypothetical protein
MYTKVLDTEIINGILHVTIEYHPTDSELKAGESGPQARCFEYKL